MGFFKNPLDWGRKAESPKQAVTQFAQDATGNQTATTGGVASERVEARGPGQYVLVKTMRDGTTSESPISEKTYLEKGGSPVTVQTPQRVDQSVPMAGQGASAMPAAPSTGPARPMSGPGAEAAIRAGNSPGAPTSATPQTTAPSPVTVDYSRYDQAAQGYDRAVQTFQSELDRLSGVDPFGNQAFLRKATDRALAQSNALASGGLSTATARAGNMRQAQGVQASMAAQGRDEQAIQRSRDEVAAGGLRTQNAAGLAGVMGQRAENEVQLAQLQTQTMTTNLNAYMQKYGIDAQLRQQDIESLRNATIELRQLSEQGRQFDTDAILKKYGIDEQTRMGLKQIAAQENISPGEFVMGLVGAGAGVAGGAIAKSDRRAKFDVRDPDLDDLADYLGRTKGKLYRYKDPHKPGRRPGLNFGPMAQDLAKSKIGRTLLVNDADGQLSVDTGRLALADHAALAELAREVQALKEKK